MGTHNSSLVFEKQCKEEKAHLKDKVKKKISDMSETQIFLENWQGYQNKDPE